MRLALRTALLAATLLGGCEAAGPAPASPVGGLRAALGIDEAGPSFSQADRVVDFAFPRDHGAHPAFRSEWWYLTSVLETPGGRRFGVQFTLFRQALRPATGADPAANGWRTGQAYLGHFAVSDVAARRHWHAERLARGHPALAGVRAAPFVAGIDGWRLASAGSGFWPLRLDARSAASAHAPAFAAELTLTATRPVVRQGDRGLSRKGPGSASYYYSVPRIEAAGTVTVADARHRVAGDAWLDREWTSGALERQHAGWDWFALHLRDGRDLMVCQLRRHDGKRSGYDFGALTAADGKTRALGPTDFALEVRRRWRGWPVAWRLTLHGAATDGGAEELAIGAAFPDQAMELSVLYWEGVVDATDAQGKTVGSGYMELTGYP